MAQRMEALERAWEEHQRRPLPPDHWDAELGGIHADLVLYDDRVAGAVANVVQHGRVDPAALRPDRALKERLRSIAALEDGRREGADEYLKYVEHLESLLELARAVR